MLTLLNRVYPAPSPWPLSPVVDVSMAVSSSSVRQSSSSISTYYRNMEIFTFSTFLASFFNRKEVHFTRTGFKRKSASLTFQVKHDQVEFPVLCSLQPGLSLILINQLGYRASGYSTCKNKVAISTLRQLAMVIFANTISFSSSKPQAQAFLLGKILQTLCSQASSLCTSKGQVIPRDMGKSEPESLNGFPFHTGKEKQVGIFGAKQLNREYSSF